jgi:AcrR family transcriptional regulator
MRDRKKQETRARLVAAAIGLFNERGFDNTTIEDIVERADFSRRTYFRHFATKEEVAFADAIDRLEGFAAQVATSGGVDDPVEFVRQGLAKVALEFSSDPVHRELVSLWLDEPALRRRYMEIVFSWEDVVARYLKSRFRGAEVACEVVATAMCGVVKAVVLRRFDDEQAAGAALAAGFAVVDTAVLGLPSRRHSEALDT